MEKYLGIRREDKNKWERRVPLIPEDIKELSEKHGIRTMVQPSTLRIYPDNAFAVPGAVVDEDLSKANTIFAVKEIPTNLLAANKTYLFFSHTIKGQPYNMAMLRRLMALKCNLIDYERIVNEKNQRLIFFGAHAGYAGIIETLFAYARKMKKNGVDSPLSEIRQAYEYASLDAARAHIIEISNKIAADGLAEEMTPLVVGFAGYGNVSKGAQDVFDLLPFIEVKPSELAGIRNRDTHDPKLMYKVVFEEKDMVAPVSGDFDLQDYYDHPQKYKSIMETHLPHLNILVNCIYWTPDYPRLVTKKYLKERNTAEGKSELTVIGDISCDIEGSIEITKNATMPDNACYTYFPDTDNFENGITKGGITVMAIDNLPCEFSKEASMFFSNVLKGYANDIVSADFSQPFDKLALPYPIKKALILHNGQLTDDYKYIKEYI